MSRPRTRPTREETRDRLLRAAAQIFITKGIGATSIEDICDEAGFSRGAFYSNFAAKDTLVIELLDTHMASSTSEVDRLLAVSESTTDFIDNMESDRRQYTGPIDIDNGGVLYVELLLYALRNPANRPKLIAHQRRLRESNIGVLQQIVKEAGREYPVPPDDIASIIMAIDVGLNLNQLIDPESYRPNQFSEIMAVLHRLWTSSPEDDSAAEQPDPAT